MTVKELLIKFQEYQLEYKVLNANFAHNAAANLFMERYGVKNCSIPDVSDLLFDFYLHIRNGNTDTPEQEIKEGISDFLSNYNR